METNVKHTAFLNTRIKFAILRASWNAIHSIMVMIAAYYVLLLRFLSVMVRVKDGAKKHTAGQSVVRTASQQTQRSAIQPGIPSVRRHIMDLTVPPTATPRLITTVEKMAKSYAIKVESKLLSQALFLIIYMYAVEIFVINDFVLKDIQERIVRIQVLHLHL